MRKIILISCGSKKLTHPAKAKDMYQSPLFKESLAYAKKLNPDKIYILSAHYNLLDLETVIEPYDVTISNVSKRNREKKPELKVLSKEEKFEWGKKVIHKLSQVSDLQQDKFLILAGKEYVKPIIAYLRNVEQPLEGIGLFERVPFLKSYQTTSIVAELHSLFNNQRRFYFPFEKEEKFIPKNGIYIIFEKGEKFKNYDRIVRVGSHNGKDRLFSRLKEHFIVENKNRSIFRKNIGRCLLSIDKSHYASLWELDTTSHENKIKHLHKLNLDFEKKLEKRISDYIQNNLSFCVFEIEEKNERLTIEKKLIATLGKSKELIPSDNWLGYHSPDDKIVKSGLWQVKNLNGESLTDKELHKIKKIMN